MNLYDPAGITNTYSLVMMGSGPAHSRVVFMTNSTLRSNMFRIRGVSGGSAVRFEGGSHEIFNGVIVSEAGAASGATGTLQVAGGSLAVRSGSIALGTLSGAAGALELSGDGALTDFGDCYVAHGSNCMGRVWVGDSAVLAVSNRLYAGQACKYSTGELVLTNRAQLVTGLESYLAKECTATTGRVTVAGDAVWTAHGSVYLGGSQAVGSWGELVLTNRGQLVTETASYLADSCTATTGRVTVAGDAVWTAGGTINIGHAANGASQGELLLRESGMLDAAQNVRIAADGGRHGSMTLRDQAVLRLGDEKILQVGDNIVGCGEFRLEGGRIVATNGALQINGSNSVAELAGGQADVRKLDISGTTGFTNTLRISGGEHRTHYAANTSGFTVGSGASDSLMEITGGTLRVPRMGRVGYGTTGTGSAILRLRGGKLIFMSDENTTEALLDVCDSRDSRGRVELLGGEMQTQTVRGWMGAANKGGTGWAELYADGGRITAINGTSAERPLVETFDQAELGAAGLTVDSAGFSVYIKQAFTDAAGADGLFVKVGDGVMTAVTNSSHAVTVVADGTLTFAQTNAAFGRALIVTNRATLSLVGAPVTQTVERLTLGDAATIGILTMDAGDFICVTQAGGLSIPAGRIRFGGAATNGTYTLFRCAGTVTAADLANLFVLNAESDRGYTFSAVADGSDTLVQLTVAPFSLADTTWTGATDGAWGTGANWSGTAVPVLSSRAVFPADAANKSITLSHAAEAGKLAFTGDGYRIDGTAPLTLKAGIETSVGTPTLAVPLALSGAVGFTGGNATTTTVSGALSSDYANVVKSGSGAFLLTGDSPAYAGNWKVAGGRLDVRSAGALGADQTLSDALVLQAGTFRWAAGTTALNKGFRVQAGDNYAAILDTVDDLALTGAFSVDSGALIKRGAGRLTLNLSAGVTTLSADNLGWGANGTLSGTVVLPASGDSPTSHAGIGGLDVLAGALCIQGQGPTKTILNQQHWTIVGGAYIGEADAELELSNLTCNEGGSGIHLLIGNGTQAGGPNHPVLRVVNQAVLKADTIKISKSPSADSYPVLAITNAQVICGYALFVGDEGAAPRSYPHLWIGAGGLARVTGNGGFPCVVNVDVRVSDGGVMDQSGSGGNVSFWNGSTSGEMVFSAGGTLKTYKLIGKNVNSATGVQMHFDGGVLEFYGADGTSLLAVPERQGFTVDAGGMTIRTGAGVKHTLTFPVLGEGKLTKTGAGELVMGPGLAYVLDSSSKASGLVTLQVMGGTEVAGGTLSISNETLAADSAITVDSGAALNLMGGDAVTFGSLSGTGLVTNGTLRAGYKLRVSADGNDRLTLADVTLPAGFAVTFDIAAGYALTADTELAVADCTGATVPNLSKWTAKGFGDHLGADFTQRGTVIYATIKHLGGTGVTLR